MKIGIDIDETLTCTGKEIRKYKKAYIRKNHCVLEENGMFSKSDFKKFMDFYGEMIYKNMKLKKDAKKYINLLFKEGHEIYFVTARSNKDVKNIEQYTKEYLEEFGLPYKKLICKAKDKGNATKKIPLDIMVDDQENFLDSFLNRDLLRLRFVRDKQIYSKYQKVTNWKEIYKIITNLK